MKLSLGKADELYDERARILERIGLKLSRLTGHFQISNEFNLHKKQLVSWLKAKQLLIEYRILTRYW